MENHRIRIVGGGGGRGGDLKKRGLRSRERININCYLFVKQALIYNSEILELLKKTPGENK